MNLLKPCPNRPKGWWNDEEADIIDVILHIFQPSLIVESGTQYGNSAVAFLFHVRRVITIDPFPKVPNGLFNNKEIFQVIGESPKCLEEKVSPLIAPNESWLFFHDGLHTANVLYEEAIWAFRNNAQAIFWHDAGKLEGDWRNEGTMLEALERLKSTGYTAIRISDSGNPGTSEEEWTGIGIALNIRNHITSPTFINIKNYLTM